MGSSHQAYISEIFSSIQGEGLLVGLRQLFIRFSGCSLTCEYCDTPESRVQSPKCSIAGTSGRESQQNPVSSEKLTEIINSFHIDSGLHHSISLTGGEPLEQVDFLKDWLAGFKKDSQIKIYLETNGLLPAHLSEVVDLIDIIGMDIKLPSVSGVKPFWNLHRDFLKIAARREIFVKAVVSGKVLDEDIVRASDLVASVGRNIPFVIQPVTPFDMDPERLMHLQEISSRRLSEVRVVPQVHRFLGMP